jgi:hypothetical protein
MMGMRTIGEATKSELVLSLGDADGFCGWLEIDVRHYPAAMSNPGWFAVEIYL